MTDLAQTGLRYAYRWRIGGVALALVVLLGAVVPTGTGQGWPHADKLGHVVAFMALTLWFAGAYEPRHYGRVALVLLLFGAAIEGVQGTLGYRTAELADWFADAFGIAVGIGIALLGVRHWCRWAERRLFRVAVTGP